MVRRSFPSPFIILTLLACFIPVFFITGCEKKPEETITTVRFVTWKPNQPEVWDEIVALFENENPDVKIERETGPHSSTAFHDLLTQKLKNRSRDVDVFFMDVIWPSEFAAAGWAMPLGDLFPVSERSAFLDGAILANTYEGKIYGVPLFVDSGVLYYRTDLLKKYGFSPPETWEQMVDQAASIVAREKKEGTGIYGFSGQFKQYEGLVCNMMEYILSNNGRMIDPVTGRSDLMEKASIGAVRFVRDRIIGNVAPRGVLTYQEPESLDVFIQGKAVFHRNWPYAWEVSNNPGRSAIAGKVGISRLPHFPGGESHSTLGGWQLGISSYSENKEAAWKFVKFLSSERVQKIIAVKSGKAPTRKILYGDREVIQANPHFAGMRDVFATAYPRPRSPLYPAISNILQRYFSKAISDPGSDLKKEAEAASEEINRIVALGR
jgi:multiple sugar transport system substrate-binding protein